RRLTGLSTGEKNYLNQRLPKVKTALENMLNMQLEDFQVPCIAISGSGGGYRSMIGLLGSLLGAQDFGLLDSSTYIAGLSGSSWMIAPWISSTLSLEQYQAQLIQRVKTDLF